MAKADDKQWLSAAECASRTGLTVRALRVYEREKLIKPPRTAKGWRRYGQAELTRLNTIVILKTLGLTLAQIRKVLVENAPSLANILQIQQESWREKRASADRALILVESARKRLLSQQTLSIDELCELVKKFEFNRSPDMRARSTLMRQIISLHITPEEERVWSSWWAQHPTEARLMQQYVPEQEQIMEEFERLAEADASPASPAVQGLLRRHNEVLERHGVRLLSMRLCEWNAPLTMKWFGISRKADSTWDNVPGAKGRNLFFRAIQESPVIRVLTLLLAVVNQLVQAQVDPASPEADAPVAQLRELCSTCRLGDAYVYTRWAPFIARANRDRYAPGEDDAAWDFLARAIQVRGGEDAEKAA